MESKLCRQQNVMTSLAKPKCKTSLLGKQNTWGNLLNKKSSTNNVVVSKKMSKLNSPTSNRNEKITTGKSVQCDLSNTKQCQSSTSLSVFNPIRTLQYLLKELSELPNIQNTGITKIVNEMQTVVERINDECSLNVPNSKLYPVMSDHFMIPTKDNDNQNLKFENNSQENKYWLLLIGKISELENNYSQLTNKFTKSEEKLLFVTSERDKLIEKFKESCDALELLNNREREYLNTITELKSKLMVSEKLISKQEGIIANLNENLNNLPNKNQIKEVAGDHQMAEQYNTYKAVLEENNELKKNYGITKLNLDHSKITYNFKENEVAKLRSEINQIKQIVLNGIENTDINSVSLLKSDNPIKGFSKHSENNINNVEYNTDRQYTEYNQKASAIKLAKTELQQLFETIKTQANLSKKLFNSSVVNNDDLSNFSDEEDNYSSVSNLRSVKTDSSC